MTISNGQTITISDLNASLAASLALLRSANSMQAAVYWLNFNFPGLVASTSSAFTTRNVVLPDDYILEEVCITAGDHTGTITVTIDNGAMIEPISMSGAASSGYTSLARYYVSDKPTQLLLKGSELTITCTTTATNATNNVQVAIGLVAELRRS